jgi:hypothetical protein
LSETTLFEVQTNPVDSATCSAVSYQRLVQET